MGACLYSIMREAITGNIVEFAWNTCMIHMLSKANLLGYVTKKLCIWDDSVQLYAFYNI